ncbi:DUF971 domain-containing protein [Candidatus Albibeggiatoa sp. nov. BB20]|uniref:DUF971 domain-containing protein n=1 Tax=Candidatus Albibeggiatoa sp. nov. BB20 TaxID=3162723 RepID=UPI0033654F50
MSTPIPTEMEFRQKTRVLSITFSNDRYFELPYEYLRVYSPSAEVRGHAPEDEVLQYGKKAVNIEKIDPVGTYAVSLHFDDGHSTGIYSWDWLYHLGDNHIQLWQEYLAKLEQADKKREPEK